MTATTPRIVKLGPGAYATADGAYHIVKDGYEPIREDLGDGRFRTTYYDALHIGPEETCWVVIETATDTNVGIEDTLRAAKALLTRTLARRAA